MIIMLRYWPLLLQKHPWRFSDLKPAADKAQSLKASPGPASHLLVKPGELQRNQEKKEFLLMGKNLGREDARDIPSISEMQRKLVKGLRKQNPSEGNAVQRVLPVSVFLPPSACETPPEEFLREYCKRTLRFSFRSATGSLLLALSVHSFSVRKALSWSGMLDKRSADLACKLRILML